MFHFIARNPRPSECVPVGWDVDVEVHSSNPSIHLFGEVTLVPHSDTGEPVSWGDPDNWISPDLLDSIEDLDDEDVRREIMNGIEHAGATEASK